MGIAGHLSTLFADIVVGVLNGAYVLAASGVMLPIIAYAVSGGDQRGVWPYTAPQYSSLVGRLKY